MDASSPPQTATASRVVVTYEDASLFASDVALLEPGQWLNDAIFTFAFEYFRHGHAETRARSKSGDVVFVDPSSLQLLFAMDAASARVALLEPIGAAQAKVLVIPVNDAVSDARQPNAGTHWALLAVDTEQSRALYLDSMPSASMRDQVVTPLLTRLSAALGTHKRLTLLQPPFPRQANSFDCGMYALAAAEHVAVTGLNPEPSFDFLSPAFISELRQRWKAIITETATPDNGHS
ncbi:hypothetical protein PTSG_01308 [Salpingoeca rosetta]|uniref:Ubiquitin-like protease family profile domain-containing protein n=1 Tax=Salpingoeca rosetta (strain ATCC 50818 / BSB-021) TaxID=946362 RepID=F2TZZ0_SALR5|nr:uncharacterized protein PTSG_01308 [Salpingoeca rosetta]EGD80718.1 hypothetical protein PTSG_01308 [Salpingoeca rosetta]|eukprot:XP_004997279.1 hypothetical protein PTSG_01308 [Salpingoeca rosetta]